MNWLNYILTFLVAPLVVGGIGAAVGAYATLKLLSHRMAVAEEGIKLLQAEFEAARGEMVTSKTCEECPLKVNIVVYRQESKNMAMAVKEEALKTANSVRDEARRTAESLKEEAQRTADMLKELTKSQMDKVEVKLDGILETFTNTTATTSKRIDEYHVFLADVAKTQLEMVQGLASVTAAVKAHHEAAKTERG